MQPQGIDHIAIAVTDLKEAERWYTERLGAQLVERRRTEGRKTGMDSVVLRWGALTLVLLQGTGPDSQVSRYIEKYGPGVHHVAVSVDRIDAAVPELQADGVDFDTPIIHAPGLRQAFARREPVSGMMFEIIERTGTEGFNDNNVRQLFLSLEESDSI